MGKTKMIIKYLLLLLILLFLNMRSYSQELFNKELKWETPDSVKVPIFQHRDQIVEWSKYQFPFSIDKTKDILIEGFNFYIAIICSGSGLVRDQIYIFKEKDKLWQLVLISDEIFLIDRIEILVDNKKRLIIFKTKSGQIGELPFEKLVDKSD